MLLGSLGLGPFAEEHAESIAAKLGQERTKLLPRLLQDSARTR